MQLTENTQDQLMSGGEPNKYKNMKDVVSSSSFGFPKEGDFIEGEIISANKNSVLVDLGSLGTGIVYPSEFYNTTSHKDLKPGNKVSAVLLDIENEDGFRELSLRQAQMNNAWQDIKEKKENEEVVLTKIININKGGLIIEINGIQGFLPLSQLNSEHYPKVEGGDTSKIVQILQKYRNQEFNVKILDFDENESKLIVSEKNILDEKLKEKMEKFSIGDIVTGTVTDVTDFGAFVKIDDDIEGLIHISEIDWKIIDDPRDVLKVGQEVEAKIATIDGMKISLSMKALKPDPWVGIDKKYQAGQSVTSEVVKITNYGVLVKLEEDLIGLILNSEFNNKRADEVVEVGKPYPMAIVSLDPEDHKMLLTFGEKIKEEKVEVEEIKTEDEKGKSDEKIEE